MLSKQLKFILLAGLFVPSFLLLNGCAESSQAVLLPQNGPTMEQVIKNQNGNIAPNNQDMVGRGVPISSSGTNVSAYTRTAMNETSNLFKPLPNPTLVLYVYPHRVGQGADATMVPGYSVPFSLYTTPQFAISGQ